MQLAIIESYCALVSGISVVTTGVLNELERYHFLKNLTLTIRGRQHHFDNCVVMGILNLTPDSFYDGGLRNDRKSILQHVSYMLEEGADIIDVGAYSTRPGASVISEEEEWDRMGSTIGDILKAFPEALVSVDTFRTEIARKSVSEGASIINDITAGKSQGMFDIAAKEGLPFVAMHMQGNPSTMQVDPKYSDVVMEVKKFLAERVNAARKAGVKDIIVDPGFGFGKSLEDNYVLLRKLHALEDMACPILVGVSRKSMVNKVLGTKAVEALNGSTVLHTIALQNGANILRVHDVRQAKEAVKIVSYLQKE